MSDIPLAWLQLTKNKIRLFGTLIGLAILVSLTLTSLGFQDALYESNTTTHRNLKGELILVHKKTSALHESIHFSRRYLYRFSGLSEVKDVSPLYLGFSRLQISNVDNEPLIIVFGVDINHSPFLVKELNKKLETIKDLQSVLIDRNSRPEYRTLVDQYDPQRNNPISLNKKTIFIEGVVDFTTASFASDVNFVTGISNFINIFSYRDLEDINIGIIELQKNVNLNEFIKKAQNDLPSEVALITRQNFIDLEKQYWAKRTPIGFMFWTFTIVSLVVEVIVIYQIMSTEITSHIPEYALLKARGYENKYFVMIVLQESMFLAILSYTFGFLISIYIYDVSRKATALPIIMSLENALIVLVLTIVLCFSSGLIASLKLRQADPINLI